ncbi:MAG: single-stranded DNA-binding protein [Patescibacteria group bacterium]
MYLNKVLLYGNLTRDPELKALPSGAQVCSFSIATNRVYKKQDGSKQEDVEFHNITVFGTQANVAAQYLKKGRPLFVEGRLHTRSWDKDGVKQYRTEIICERFQFGASGPGAAGGSSAASSESFAAKAPKEDAIEYPQEDINPDDIPF